MKETGKDVEKDEEKIEKEQTIFEGIIQMIKDVKISEDKREKVLICFLLGIFLLLIATPVSTFSGKKGTDKKQTTSDEKEQEMKNTEKDAYITWLENKLEQTIEGMEGAGEVDVMITLKDNGEKILDKNQPYESEKETSKEEKKEITKEQIANHQETVLVEKEGDTEPIIIREMYPDIEGVVVVCEGGGDSGLSLQIKEAVQALFSIDAHKIVVCKSK